MNHNPDRDTGLYFIVGALIVIVTVVFVILSGWFPFYGERRDDVRIETPRAEMALPQPPVV